MMYNRYFGLRESPFNVTPDPRFFYANPVYLETYAALRYGIEAKKGFIVVTGEVGTGKTTLLRKLLRSFETNVRSVFIFNTYIDFPELLQVALRDLGLASRDTNRVTLLEELNGYLIAQLKQGNNVAMLIDEAQNLSVETLENLRLLSNLETDQEKLLQIVLMGQPELEAKLDQPKLRQLKQRVAVQCGLGPLKNDEVGPYINFRLRTAGYEGKDLFHRDAVRQIAFYSKGIPRLMNIICDNALLIAYAESRKIVPVDIIKQVARDLRLELESEVERDTVENKPASDVHAQPPPARLASNTTQQPFLRKPPEAVPQHTAKRFIKAGLGTALGLLFLLIVATIFDPRNGRIQTTGKNLEAVERKLPQKTLPQAASAEIAPKRKGQRVIIRQGATIFKIVGDVYGANTALGMDLIKEFNPHIENLNWIYAGQDLMLPFLTQETLLRPQPDGSYHLIAASFHSRAGADEFARLLSNRGHLVSVITRRVADDLLLHRVEIDGLKSREEAEQIWQTGLSN